MHQIKNSIIETLKYFNLKSKLTQFYLFLVLLILISLVQTNNNFILIQSVLSVILFKFLGFIYCVVKRYIYRDKLTNPNNILISISIIFLIIHQLDQNSNHSFFAQSIIIILLLIIKELNLLRIKGQPIFNPAVLSIILYFLIFDREMSTTFVSWWGANLNKNFLENDLIQFFISTIFLLLLVHFAISFKRIYYALAFLVTYFSLQAIIAIIFKETYLVIQNHFSFFQFIINSLTNYYHEILSLLGFFIFVMLIEPKTTPSKKQTQLLFGFIAAIIYVILNSNKNTTGHNLILSDDTELIAILISNLFFGLYRIISQK